jgi:hypothetical protein
MIVRVRSCNEYVVSKISEHPTNDHINAVREIGCEALIDTFVQKCLDHPTNGVGNEA